MENGEQIVWKVHPAIERPRMTAGAVMLILGFGGLVLWSFASIAWAALSCVILFLSLARYFLPTTYLVNQRRIESSTLGFSRKRLLSQFQRAQMVRGGIFLSPFLIPNRLENYRGMLVLCHNNQTEVFEFVKRRIGEKKVGS